MGSILTLIIIASISMLIVRTGALALMATGLSADASMFQACSAYFGVGFTTREAELVVSHPVRRKIVTYLIVIGNVGVMSALATVVVGFVGIKVESIGQAAQLLGVGLLGVLFLIVITRSGVMSYVIDPPLRFLMSTVGIIRVLDYELLLRVEAGYCVSEVEVEPGHWLIGKMLVEANLGKRGVIVLGIARSDGVYIGTPSANTVILEKDALTVYGREKIVESLVELEENLPAVA